VEYRNSRVIVSSASQRICWQEKLLWGLAEDDPIAFNNLKNNVPFYDCLIAYDTKMKRAITQQIKYDVEKQENK